MRMTQSASNKLLASGLQSSSGSGAGGIRQHVSDGGDLIAVFVFSKRGDQVQHLLVRRDICFGGLLHQL